MLGLNLFGETQSVLLQNSLNRAAQIITNVPNDVG